MREIVRNPTHAFQQSAAFCNGLQMICPFQEMISNFYQPRMNCCFRQYCLTGKERKCNNQIICCYPKTITCLNEFNQSYFITRCFQEQTKGSEVYEFTSFGCTLLYCIFFSRHIVYLYLEKCSYISQNCCSDFHSKCCSFDILIHIMEHFAKTSQKNVRHGRGLNCSMQPIKDSSITKLQIFLSP